jgi:hypothetical protein
LDTREIPRDGWIEFLDAFSKRHEGSLVDVDVLGQLGAQKEASERPLEGVSSDKGGRRIAIAVGPSAHLVEHIIQDPSRLRVQEDRGADVALQIESAAGETTLLTVRSPATEESGQRAATGAQTRRTESAGASADRPSSEEEP